VTLCVVPALTKRDQKVLGGFAAFVLLSCCSVGALSSFAEDDDSVTPPRTVVATTPAQPAATVTTEAEVEAADEPEVTEEALDEPEPTKTTSKPKPRPKPKPVRTTEEPEEPEEAEEPEDNDVYYSNCSEARADGAAPLYRGDPGYRPGLDRDGDGDACE